MQCVDSCDLAADLMYCNATYAVLSYIIAQPTPEHLRSLVYEALFLCTTYKVRVSSLYILLAYDIIVTTTNKQSVPGSAGREDRCT